MSAEELERELDLDGHAQLLIDGLADDEAARLAAAVAEARIEYAEALDAFAEGVLGAIPGPLRGRAARILARG